MNELPAVPISELSPAQAAEIAANEAARRQRTMWVAYVLCVLLGTLGIHRFYLRRKGSALAMLLTTVLTLGVGWLVTLPWHIVDLFLIPRIIREENEQARMTAYGRFGLLPPQIMEEAA